MKVANSIAEFAELRAKVDAAASPRIVFVPTIGTPDRITMYGGWAAPNGTAHMQRFPADAETAKLIPEATTNVWTLQMIPDKRQFTYYLERNNEARYKARFNLKTSSK